jgi:hypothetical protein
MELLWSAIRGLPGHQWGTPNRTLKCRGLLDPPLGMDFLSGVSFFCSDCLCAYDHGYSRMLRRDSRRGSGDSPLFVDSVNMVAGRAILLGTPNNSGSTSGNVFEDFIVNRNVITYASSLVYAGVGILANTSPTAHFDFVRRKVLGNTVTGSGVAQGTGIDLRRMTDGLVLDNTTALWNRGIGVENSEGTVVRNNREQ